MHMESRTSPRQEPGYLVLLMVLSFGLYSSYWFYRNWRLLKEQGHSKIRPALRAVGIAVPLLDIYLTVTQLKSLKQLTSKAGGGAYFPAGWVSFGSLLFCYLYGATGILFTLASLSESAPLSSDVFAWLMFSFLFSLLMGLVLIVPQRALNEYADTLQAPPRKGLTTGEIAWLSIGGLAWVLSLAELYLPIL